MKKQIVSFLKQFTNFFNHKKRTLLTFLMCELLHIQAVLHAANALCMTPYQFP